MFTDIAVTKFSGVIDQSTSVKRADSGFGQQEVIDVVKLPLVMGNHSKPMDQVVFLYCL